jgi:hypothetical protein
MMMMMKKKKMMMMMMMMTMMMMILYSFVLGSASSLVIHAICHNILLPFDSCEDDGHIWLMPAHVDGCDSAK